jgi:hypothetical protein
MPMSADLELGAEYRRGKELARHQEVTPEWMDEMITRVFNETKRRIKQIEDSTATKPHERAAEVRMLASLQQTLEKTVRMKRGLAAHQEIESSKKNDADDRQDLHSRLARINAGQRKRLTYREPE